MEFIERLETKIVPTARIWAARIDDGMRTLRPHLERWNGKVRIWTEKVITQVSPEVVRRIRAAHRKAVKASAKAREGPPAIVEKRVVAFDPATPLLWLSPHDPFRLVDAFEGVHVFGGNGSGKTSGAGNALAKSYLASGMGGLVLTAKPDEADLWERYARETGRTSSIIRFNTDSRYRFNWLRYEQQRPSRGGGLTANIVKLITTMQKAAFERGEDAGGKQERYWANALSQLLSNAIDLCLLSGEPLSVAKLYEIITSAPVSPEQVDSETWQVGSLTYQLLERALANPDLTARQKADLRLTGKFFLTEFPQLPHDTRGSITSTFTTTADGFLRGAIGELFSTGLNLVPEMTLEGAIVIADFPVKSFGHTGLAAQVLLKMIFQGCWERRDVNKNPRPVFLWCDEAHTFCTEQDVMFQTTARSARACGVYMSQSLPNYYWALGGEDKGKALTDSLMGVLGTKIFCNGNDPATNKWASDIFGKSWQQRSNHGTSHGDQGNRTTNTGGSESLEYVIEPSVFTKLRKGGPANNFEVDSLIFAGGRTFKATGAQYLHTVFNQRG